MTETLGYGLREMPAVKAAWGARMIFPNDVVWDRTDMIGSREDKDALLAWLNDVAPSPGSVTFLNAVHANTDRDDEHVFLIFHDETGVIKASAQGSHGYLYVSAWLKEHTLDDEGNG